MKTRNRSLIGPARFLPLALLGCLLVGCGSSNGAAVAPQPPVDDTPQATVAERLQGVLEQAVTAGLPGAALSVRGDDVIFDGVAGVEDIATAVPLTIDHRFYLASVGKAYTAVAMVKLAADGLLNLDDPITSWLPAEITDWIPYSDAITVRSLLNHTSGIFDYQDDADEWLYEAFLPDPTRHWTNADVVPFFLDKPPHFEPLTDVSYSDSNYILVGLIAEAASGLPIQDVIRNYILAPLGSQQAVNGYEAQGLPGFVHGYVELDGELMDVYPWYSHYGVTDGGMQSSAADLAAFVSEVLTSDTVVDNAMRAELLTPPDIGEPRSMLGLGFDIDVESMPGTAVYFGQGQDAGSRAEFFHYAGEEKSVTIVLSVSASLGEYDVLYDQFHQAALEVLIDADVLPGAQP